MLTDSYGRQIRDLRISLTDRCNFRCFYCLPDGEPPLARKATILTFEEIVEISEIFVALGIEKIRLTGGEPLLRKDVERLVEKIARLKDPANVSKELLTEPEANPKSEIRNPKLLDLALTTNGHTLDRRAEALKLAGLDRVTVSLDSLDPANFRDLTGVDRLAETLAAIAAAKRAGLEPVRVNAVVVRGRNDHEIVALARFAREQALAMRFIEYMPLDSKNEWDRKLVVAGREIRQTIDAVFPLVLSEQTRGSATAWKYAFADGAPGEIGIIAPVTEMFCGACSRIRLTADGQLRTCLFSTREHNLRDVLRGGADRAEIVRFIREAVNQKEPRHTINDEQFAPASRSMSFIGG